MKKILITGATDGIGLETAKFAASQGHHLLMHGRSEVKLKAAVEAIKQTAPNTTIDSYLADLSTFSDIALLTRSVLEQHSTLDVIINNAGVFKTAHRITEDNLDVRFVVNTFAPVILTLGLLPILADDGRIVNLSSAAQAPIDVNAMSGETMLSDDFQAYAQSKLALTIWTQEVAKSLKPNQVCVAVNPASMLASKMVKDGFGVAGNDLNIGVQILMKAATDDKFATASGKYFDNDAQRFSPPHPFALSEENCAKVISELNSILMRFRQD